MTTDGIFVSSTARTPDAKARPPAGDARTRYGRRTTVVLLLGPVRPGHGIHRRHRPAGYDQVIFRRYPDPGQLIVFWLSGQRVQAGMNVNIRDVADDIERLVQSPHPADTDDLADPGSRSRVCSNGRPGQCCSVRDAAIQRTVT